MKIKTKIALALASLFAAIIGIMFVGLFYIHELSDDAQNILKNNYESVAYCKMVVQAIDSVALDSATAIAHIDSYIRLQEKNVTENGEGDLTLRLRKIFEHIQSGDSSYSYADLRKQSMDIQDVNMKAIENKNEITENTASRAKNYLIFITCLVAVFAFTFIVNFPGYIADPITTLTNSIQSIANRNYEERLDFKRTDEFGDLSEAFNRMAEKMDEYEHSNLAKILFEKRRIETIINRMSDPVIGLDEHRKVMFVNDQALHLLHLEKSQILNRYAPDVAVENDLFRALIRPADAVSSSLIKIVVNGKENYFSKENIPIEFIPTGEKKILFIGDVILLKNITSYKEQDLAKTNFIATISHELKTPIASLQMGIKLLADQRIGTLNEEQQSITKTINEETNRLSRITNELLDLAQVETGNIKLAMTRVNCSDLIHHSVEAVKFQAERKGVHIEIDMPKKSFVVNTDEERTSWVLVNFLTNAIRYSAENSSVIIKCVRSGKNIVFTVKDFGIGIDAKYTSRLFEKFFQVPGTSQGTGLGLAISKEFIEAQGGTIGVESETGKGSVFYFSLPESDPG